MSTPTPLAMPDRSDRGGDRPVSAQLRESVGIAALGMVDSLRTTPLAELDPDDVEMAVSLIREYRELGRVTLDFRKHSDRND